MMRVIYPGVPMGRIVRKFYGTLYRGCKAFSPCHPVSAALHGNAVKGILPVWGSAIKFEREFLDEFNQIIRFLSLDHVKGKFALKMALENYRNLVDIVEQQEIWDKKGVYLVSYPCRDMGNALKNVEDPIFARLFGIMPAWLKSIIKSVVLTGVFHIQHTYSFKVDAREYHLVCKQCDEWDDDGNLTDVGSWTIFYHRRNHIFAHLGSPTFDECGECDGRVFFEDYYKVKVHYNPEWSFDMYQEFIMDDMDSQALHPVNSLSVLARHCGLDMRLGKQKRIHAPLGSAGMLRTNIGFVECDRWWWARFIHQITINQLYTLNDIGPPSLGHQCGDEQRFVNYIGEMDH